MQNEKKITIPEKRADAHQWLLGFKEIKEYWLDEVKAERTGSKKTEVAYLDRIEWFIRFMNMTPPEIIAKGSEEVRKEQVGVLKRKTWADRTAIAFFNHLLDEKTKTKTGKKWTRHAAKNAYGTVRSFLRYNGFTFKGKTPVAVTQTTTKLPSNAQLAQAWKIASLPQKLAVGVLRSTIWRPEDALELRYGDLQEQYDARRFYIEKVTQKKQLPVGVYLTTETTEIVRLHMRKVYGSKKPDANDKVLAYGYDALLKLVQRFGENVGLKLSPGYFRKIGRTRCGPVIGNDALFKMAGWALPGVGRNYVLPAPEDTLKEHLRIEQLLTFELKTTSEGDLRIKIALDDLRRDPRFSENLVKRLEDEWLGKPPEIAIPQLSLEAEAFQRITEREGITREDAARISKDAINKEIEEIKRERQRPKTATNGGCTNGVHCQRIVSEADLGGLLAQGWRVAAVLPSGKIVVAND